MKMEAASFVNKRAPYEPETLPTSVEEFLDWSEGREGKHEFVRGTTIKMAPELSEHVIYKSNMLFAFDRALRATAPPLRLLGDGIGLLIPEGSVRQPDLSINEGSLVRGERLLAQPFLVAEVTSPSTAMTDEAHKLREYFTIPTIRHYVIAYPDSRSVVWHDRSEGGSETTTRMLASGSMTFAPYDLTIAVEDIFDDSAFE